MRLPALLLSLVLWTAVLPALPVHAQTTSTDATATTTIALPIDTEIAGSNDGKDIDVKGEEGTYERAIIKSIGLTSIPSGQEVQQHQQYTIEVLSGSLNGQTRVLSSDLASNPYGLTPAVGDKVVVLIQGSATQGNELIFLEGFDRRTAMLWLLILFVLTLVMLAGWQGFKVAVSILLSILLIGWILIPSFLHGINPIPVAIGLAVVLAAISSYSATGWSKKTWVTIVGTLGGILIAYLLSSIFAHWANLGGLASDDDRVFFAKNPTLDPRGLMFAGIIIASLGVVEDVAVSIASGVFEVQHANPNLTVKQLFRSGMVVGRDHMSALANTLIFAYVGGSLSTLLLYTQFGGSWLKFLNFDSVVDEVIRSLCGTIALVFTVPITALLAAIVASRQNNAVGNDRIRKATHFHPEQ
ncbi:MAG: YibE/F family protein [Patescibacteria group bacterium]